MSRRAHAACSKETFPVQRLLSALSAFYGNRKGGRLPFTVVVRAGCAEVRADLGKTVRLLLQLVRILKSEIPIGNGTKLEILNRRFYTQEGANLYGAAPGAYVEFVLSADAGPDSLEERRDCYADGGAAPLLLRFISSMIRKEGGALVAAADEDGSHYRFVLPAAVSDISRKVEKIVYPERTELPTILVVDQDPSILGLVESGLKLKGYPVIAARDGEQALESFERRKKDVELLFIDAALPGIDGPSLAKNASMLKPGVRVILTSASGIPEEREKLRDLENSAFISKPYPLTTLFALIDSLLGARTGS